MASEPRNYPDYVFVAYDEDFSAQTYDIAVSLEPGNLVGRPVKYIRHDLNTLPAPAATDTGLVRYDLSMFGNGIVEMGGGAYVRADQAEKLLAAERAEKERLADDYQAIREQLHRGWQECCALKDDNAAQAARIKDLEWKAHNATISNRIDEDSAPMLWSEYAEALEAKLAAAEKVREAAIELDEAISDDFNIFGAQQKLRAALGGKP
nr:hypothetical protein [Brucella anthropi]